MGERYYTKYVRHMLKYYLATAPEEPVHKSESDCINWHIADRFVTALHPTDQEILYEIFTRKDTIPDNIYELSREYGISQDQIWTMLDKLTKDMAKARGLI